MELLDYAEQQGQEAAKFSLATLELSLSPYVVWLS